MAMDAEKFELPSGEVVQLRGLSGFEVMLSRKKYQDDEIGLNGFMVSCSLGITEDAALTWIKEHLAGDFVALVDRVQEVSGLTESARKEARKSL